MLDRVRRRILRTLHLTADGAQRDHADLAGRFDALALELRDLNATTTNDYRQAIEQVRLEIDHNSEMARAEAAQIREWVEEYITAVRAHLELHANASVDAATEALQIRLRRVERSAVAASTQPATAQPATVQPATVASGTNGVDEPTPVAAAPSISSLGIDYSSFEDELRGSPEHVRALEAVHVDTIAGFGAADLPVLDVGCGRGEFLQLLTEAGIANRGIDLNQVSVDDCRDLGLDVVAGDAVAHLRSLEPGSLRAVCGFHLVEHLTDAERTALLVAARHAIAPGGGIVFETPNPENLRVGATNFWLDPTHLRPIPPQLLQFQVEQAGFDDVEIQRLHPSEERLPDAPGTDAEAVVDFVNGLIGGPMDYAVVARVRDEATD